MWFIIKLDQWYDARNYNRGKTGQSGATENWRCHMVMEAQKEKAVLHRNGGIWTHEGASCRRRRHVDRSYLQRYRH